MAARLGAYVLPGDPVWLEATLGQYYGLLDELVVPVPRDGRGWTGVAIPVEECLAAIRRVDRRGILREIPGEWIDREHPIFADTAQRQAALDSLRGRVDWVLQLDGDEFLPRSGIVHDVIAIAEREGAQAIELPMRVLFRRTRRHVFEVCGAGGSMFREYPGPVIVRPDVRLVDARRADVPFLRVVAEGSESSLQLRRSPEEREIRVGGMRPEDAIVHNSWARPAAEIRRKGASWGHARGFGFSFARYYRFVWWPAPVLWRVMRDFHPFVRDLWPRLARLPNAGVVGDRPTAPEP